MNRTTYDPLFLRGVEEFNRCHFFDSHELWEAVWLEETGSSREFYKGLIQAAVALHHLANGNAHGARKLLDGSRGYLAPYCSHHLGLDVDRFLRELTRCIDAGLAGKATPGPALDPALVPEIRLDPPPGTGGMP